MDEAKIVEEKRACAVRTRFCEVRIHRITGIKFLAPVDKEFLSFELFFEVHPNSHL